MCNDFWPEFGVLLPVNSGQGVLLSTPTHFVSVRLAEGAKGCPKTPDGDA